MGSAAEVERPVSKLEAMLESVGLEGVYEWGEEVLTWAWSFISNFGGPVKQTNVQANFAINETPPQSQAIQANPDMHPTHGGAWKMWNEMHACHEMCREDRACHEKCPKPWSHED